MVKLYIGIAIVCAASIAFAATYSAGYKAGANNVRVEIAKEVRGKLNAAQTADDATTRCLADAQCRLSNDGYRRD